MRSSGSPGSWPPSAAEFRCVFLTLHSHPETSNLFPEFSDMLWWRSAGDDGSVSTAAASSFLNAAGTTGR